MTKKKSPMLRVASVMLVLCMVLSCSVFGTLAKYTSATNGTDGLKVAKWEFEVDSVDIANTTAQTIELDLFNTIQDDNNPTVGGADDGNVDNAADTAANTAQIIAPGTGGAFNLVVKNLSEVDAEYDLDLTITKSDNTIPVEFKAVDSKGITLHDWTYNIDDLDFTNRQLAYLNQGTDIDEETITISWRWAFEQPADGDELATKDAADTALGIAAQASAPTIEVQADIVATQVD